MRRTNALQRDPNIAKAFDNLAGLFAPPSGADFVASAAAQAKRQEIEQQAELWRLSADPNADKRVFDQRAVALGRGSIANGFYGVDTQAATARSNNAADNARALQQTGMQQSGETTRSMLAPVAQGATRFVPPTIAQMYGVPGTQTGVVEMKPGEQSVLPDGRTLSGPAKPPTMDEAKAGVFQQMPQDQQQAVVFGNTPIEQIIMDGQTKNVTRPGSLGQTPVPPPGDKGKTFVDANGAPVVNRPDGSFTYTDGRPLPPDAKLFNVPTPTGSQQDVGMGTTANKSRAQAIRGTVANADRLMADIDQTIRANPASAGVAANIVSFGQDVGQVFKEFGERFGNPNTPVSIGDLQALAARVAPGDYNPVYRRVRAQLLELAYSNARLNNPSGEVSRYSLEREIEALGLGSVGNDQAVLAVLDASRSRLRRSLAEADVLEGSAKPPTPDTLYTPQVGQPAQPGATQPPRTRMRFDANGNPVQ